ncbi:MAG: dockerin type I domain-containing protein [Phycisphaerae bacterium]
MTNNGTLTARDFLPLGGGPVLVTSLTILNNGTIVGENGRLFGGAVRLRAPGHPIYLPGTFQNNGQISGGWGAIHGGSVRISYYNGVASNAGIISGGGSDNGGGGNATMAASSATNEPGATIAGGVSARGTGRGGAATLLGTDAAINRSGASVTGGDSISAAGGDASVESEGLAQNDGPEGVFPAAAILGGDGCQPGKANLYGGQTVNRGVVAAGQSTCGTFGSAGLDPPNGLVTGATRLTADNFYIVAGDSLTIGGFDAPLAVDAGNWLEIIVAPGGTLDLRNNPPGTTWMHATNGIFIEADNILLDPGVTLDQIMSPPPTVLSGGRFVRLYVSPTTDIQMHPGESLDLEIVVGNSSNMPDQLQYTLSQSLPWATLPPDEPLWNAAAIEIRVLPIQINVPPTALPGETNTITLTANTVATFGSAVSELHLSVPPSPCPGDVNGDRVVSESDLGILLGSWQTAVIPFSGADLNGDGTVTSSDLGILLANWHVSCP